MAYNPTQAPAHLPDFDALRKWVEEELRNLAQNYADDTKALGDGTGSVAADLAALDVRVTAAESDIGDNTTDIATNTSDIATLDGRVDQADDLLTANVGATALTTTNTAAIVSLAVTAGTWDLYLKVHFIAGGTTSSTDYNAKLSATAALITFALDDSWFERRPAAADWNQSLTIGPVRVVLGSTTTYYGNVRGVFTAGTLSAEAIIMAKRVIV